MIEIAEVKLHDVPEVHALLKTTWEQTFIDCLTPLAVTKIASEWFHSDLLSRQVDDPDIFFVAAKDEKGKIAGIATARLEKSVIVLSRLYVLPDYQGQQIGSTLLKHVTRAFPSAEKISLTVATENKPAITFYERQGFSAVVTRKEIMGDAEVELCVMDKKLI